MSGLEGLEALNNCSRTQNTSLPSQWKPAKSLSNYKTRRSQVTRFTSKIHTNRTVENDMKPVHKQVVDLSNELDKNLGQKNHQNEMKHLGLNETMLCPWRNNESLSKCNHLHQRKKWNVNSKLQPLSYQPSANFHERFLKNKLSVLGIKSNMKERNDDRISTKQKNIEMEAGDIENGSDSLTDSLWSESFTQARVRRLNEVFLSLSENEGMKLRSRRLKCSCLFHQ